MAPALASRPDRTQPPTVMVAPTADAPPSGAPTTARSATRPSEVE
jgi:hypothetical protein